MRAAVVVVGLAGCSFTPGALSGSRADAAVDTTDDAPDVDGPMLDAPGESTSTARRIQLSFRNAARASNLDGFPVLVKLDSTRIPYAEVAPLGADLRFFDSDGTALPYEIEHWDTGGTSIVWVRVPRIDAASDTDFISMHYGNPAAVDAQDPPSVWSDAVAVWHLADDPGPGGVGEIRDSSAAARHGTASAGLTAANRVAAMIGDGLDLPGNLTGVTALAVPLATYTYSFWIRGNAAPVTGSGNKQALSNGDTNFNFSWDHNLTAFTAAVAQRDASAWQSISAGALQATTWYLVTGTYDGASLCMALDGAGLACATAQSPLVPSGFLLIGSATSTSTSFAGRLDEIRILSVVRSADWINAEYASQKADPATPFVVFGAPEVL